MTGPTVPEWINAKLFQNTLKGIFKDFEKIVNFKAFGALAPGENYATLMLKIQIEVLLKSRTTERISFMLKVAHDSDFHRQELSKWDMFSVEYNMYHHIKPELEHIYRDIGLEVRFGAKAYKLPTQREYILLEDLTRKGFRNADRLKGLDMDHCKAVLTKIAQWHAASAVRIERKGLYYVAFTKGLFNENCKDVLKMMLDGSLKHLLKSVKNLKNHQLYYQQLENMNGRLVDIFFEKCALDEQDFNVLNHGDCWSNNIMFQYDNENKLQEIYLVDLQFPHYGSPAHDLLYFIISSAQLNIKLEKFDYMVKYYHDHLIQYLTLLKYKQQLPTLKEIHQAIFKNILWGMVIQLHTYSLNKK